MSAARRRSSLATLALAAALGASACRGSDPAADQARAQEDAAATKATPAADGAAAPVDGLGLTVVGVGRLNQGDDPPQAVLDQRRAQVEAALAPIRQCLLSSDSARAASTPKLELVFGEDDQGRERVNSVVTGVQDDALAACLRASLGDTVEPGADERIAVRVVVLVAVEWAG